MTATETRPEASLRRADDGRRGICRRLPDLPYAPAPGPDTDHAEASAGSRPAFAPSSPADRSTP
ncbi:hypothetical protein ACQF36_01770 [Streptomyces sp. Marseille-Q5077]|uniref:hypothetical protein n=1 Tax=Streptomyces sp. Marseille-Q5077 TaxID=3418995 RepID=UPI003D023285